MLTFVQLEDPDPAARWTQAIALLVAAGERARAGERAP